nr:class I SAM-dependent methyltransferase [Leucobacter edaphi]
MTETPASTPVRPEIQNGGNEITDPGVSELIAAWEAQQNAYVANRAERFGIVLDAIAYARPGVRTILDAGGGLGSFSRLILERFPEVRVATLDIDPALLSLASANLSEFGDRSLIVDADLVNDDWPAALEGWLPEIVVSSTALHWLPSGNLVSLYERLARLLPEGGLFFNADHLPLSREGSFFQRVSWADDARQQGAFAEGVPDWDAWWQRFAELDGFAEVIAEREARFAAKGNEEHLDVSPAFHTVSLRVAGFGESGTLWQHFDDYVVYGVR